MRLVIAVELEQTLATQLEEATGALRALEPGLGWVPPIERHLVIKLLGEVSDAALPALMRATESVARNHRPFELRAEGIVALPNFRRMRVVCVGLAADPRLELLHHDLEVACSMLGHDLEGRPFRPHVTLARVPDRPPFGRVRALAREARTVAFTGSQHVDAVSLLACRSESGAPCRRVHAAPLGGR